MLWLDGTMVYEGASWCGHE